jgi:hypothetical protein
MRTRLADWIRIGVAVVLGGIGAAAGFTHTHDWAVSHGQAGWLAWATAVVIEGMAVVAGIELHYSRHAGQPYVFPAVVLVFGVLVQMTAQVAEAEPSPAGWLVAAMPALGFLAVVKLLMRRMPTTPDTPGRTDAEDQVAVIDAHAGSTAPTATPPASPPVLEQREDTTVPRVKLPADITARIDAAVDAARTEGREPSPEDIQRVARIPADLARRVLADHQPLNGHHITD